MYVIPVAYYVVKPDGGLQQAGPRIEVVGNTATLRQQDQQQGGYYYDQQGNMQKYPYYGGNNNNQYGYNNNQAGWGGYYPQQQQQQAYFPQPQQPQYPTNMYPPQQQGNNNYYQQQNYPPGGNMVAPVGPQQPPVAGFHRSQPSLNNGGPVLPPKKPLPQEPAFEFYPTKTKDPHQRPPVVTSTGTVSTRPGSHPGSRTNSLERQRRKPSTGEIQVEIPPIASDDRGAQGPLSTGSLPPSYEPSPRHREFREAMEQPIGPKTPPMPPRQLFELPFDPKKDPPPPQHVRHVRPQDLVPPEVMQMYSGRKPQDPQMDPNQQQFEPPITQVGGSQSNFSRSSSLRRSGQFYDEAQRRRGQQQPSADLVKTHLNLSNSREHLGPSSMRSRQQQQQQTRPLQHYAEPISSQNNQPGIGQETTQLVRHIPAEEAARLPQELFEEKPKWQPLRPDKFSVFGKEAAYPPFPVIGPRYMISISGGAKLIEILLSIAVIVLVTIICDRGRCFPRTYIPMATEVVMWIVAGCAIIGTVFICIPYARKTPISPKAYYRFLLVEVVLTCLGAFSYFVASISLLVIKEGEIIGYLIETWVCAAALGFICGVLYVCSTVFAWLALQRAKYYLDFLRYAAARHREDPSGLSYRLSVHPNPSAQPPQQPTAGPPGRMPQNVPYSRPPTLSQSTLTRYNY